jgi:beta-lactamase superfamily II metal-dependent hydrolase
MKAENSIVVRLNAGGFRELFMGDPGEASEASEARLLAENACHRPILRTDLCGAISLTVGLPPATMLQCMPPSGATR